MTLVLEWENRQRSKKGMSEIYVMMRRNRRRIANLNVVSEEYLYSTSRIRNCGDYGLGKGNTRTMNCWSRDREALFEFGRIKDTRDRRGKYILSETYRTKSI